MTWGSSIWGRVAWGAPATEECYDDGHTTVQQQDFLEDDFILNFKPLFKYEPPEPEEDLFPVQYTEPTTAEEARQETEDIIKSYQAIEQLTAVAQDKLNSRVMAAGGVNIRPHPVKDNLIVQAIKRQFPDEDGSRVTFEMYQECLRRMEDAAEEPPVIKEEDMRASRKDLLRTDFGGLSNADGSNRPEISGPEFVKPINIDEFKNSSIKQMLKTVQPMVEEMIEDD